MQHIMQQLRLLNFNSFDILSSNSLLSISASRWWHQDPHTSPALLLSNINQSWMAWLFESHPNCSDKEKNNNTWFEEQTDSEF